MAAHDVSNAADRLLAISVDGYAPGHNRPGMCLRWSYFAYNLQPNLTAAGIAMDAWTNAPAEHRHAITATTVVPKGLPIILGPSPTRTDDNRNAGDVFPALGTGAGLAGLGPMTDSPRLGAGRIGIATLGERAIQTKRPVLGYLTRWLGYDLAAPAAAAAPPAAGKPATATPIDVIGEGDMENVKIRETGHQFEVGFASISHFATQGASDITRKVMSTTDEQHTLTIAQAKLLWDALNIPTKYVDAITLRREHKDGKWSALSDIQTALSKK